MSDDADSGSGRGDLADWDGHRYDDDHAYVYEYGADLVDLLDPAAGERVLDLGCGTGHLSGDIAERGAEVVGIDRSPEMLARARRDHPDVTFRRADAREFSVEEPFDAVFSNAALHWIPESDHDRAIESIHGALHPGGRLVAELGGHGNVAAIREAITAALAERGRDPAFPWYFPRLGEYAARLEAGGFEVTLARLFDRPTVLGEDETGVRDWVETFASGSLDCLTADEREAVLADVADRLRGEYYRDGRWVGDYRRLRVVATRL